MGEGTVKSRSVLSLYLEKIAAGDKSCVDKLCKRLADRLLYVPITKPAVSAEMKGGSDFKIEVVCLKDKNDSLVPVFTNESLLKTWCKEQDRSVSSISLLGADLCTALEKDASLWIDPSTDHAVRLEPEIVKQISEVELDESDMKVA